MNLRQKFFTNKVWEYYKLHGRHNLLWRKTKNPYHILVSEMMLQQTQVERVVLKYKIFLKQFPDVQSLAKAPLSEVFTLWQGLGYNRRAKMLHQSAKKVVEVYGGTFPKQEELLRELPGVGPYTASAVVAFAYNTPTFMIETNIRTVFIYHFFKTKTQVSDKQILRHIKATLDTGNIREWYYALMDYGSHIKKTHGNLNHNSMHYTKQSTFKGSDRQLRGAIIRLLTKQVLSRVHIHAKFLHFEDIKIDAILQKLQKEGMIVLKNKKYSLPK